MWRPAVVVTLLILIGRRGTRASTRLRKTSPAAPIQRLQEA